MDMKARLQRKKLSRSQDKIKRIGYIIDKLAYFESQLNELENDLACEIGLEESIDNLNRKYIKLMEGGTKTIIKVTAKLMRF